VELDVGYMGTVHGLKTAQLPVDIHELQANETRGNRYWVGAVSGGGSIYVINLFVGSKASAADRASILRALGSIRHAH
jgi:hypothetical protein